MTTIARLAAVSVGVFALAGCGGSEPDFTRDSVQDNMTEVIRGNLKAGATMDPLECVMDGDQYHWKCIASVRVNDMPYRLTTNLTCDGDTGQCLSEPQALQPS